MRKIWGQESIGTILQRNRTNVLISLKLEKGLNLLSHTHELINIAQQKGLNLSRKLRHLRSNLLAMIRESLSKHLVGLNKEFRFRGVEPGRLENFSDACFALAITLLLISTSPPSSFEQVKRFTWEVIPFTLCISLIILIWHQHFVFYFRYGLRNPTVTVLNTIFIVIVLFYVYPLKFLTKAILLPLTALFGEESFHAELAQQYKGSEMGKLMIIYGIGATAVFYILMFLYRYALKKADELELTEIERFDTVTSVRANFIMGSIPLLSVLVALIVSEGRLASMIPGLIYFLYSPAMSIFWRIRNKKRSALLMRLTEGAIVEEIIVSNEKIDN